VHRSRLLALVIAIVVAACSTRDDSASAKTLSQDSALAAHIDTSQHMNEKTANLPFPDACNTVAIPDQPASAGRAEAAELAHKAYSAEMLGNLRDAGKLLRRASELDWTDKVSAYHLGRVSEALGERADAINAYCRFMALAPSMAEQLDASQRVKSLALAQTHVTVAAGNVVDSGTMSRGTRKAIPRRATQKGVTADSRGVARNRIERSVPAVSTERSSQQTASVAAGARELPTPTKPANESPIIVDKADTVEREVIMRSAPGNDQSRIGSRTERRSANTARAAGIGAVAGAIVGGAAGRSVKSAAIGAAAGGILGVIAAQASRPPIRGIRS
jgi:hypothetical protein